MTRVFDTKEASTRVNRRTLLYGAGATLFAGPIAGCTNEDGNEESNGAGEGETDMEDGGEEMSDEESVENEENGDDADDEQALLDDDQEPDYDDWFDDAENYEGTVDLRGENDPVVIVGAGDQGFEFEPPAIMVDPGTSVIWEWSGEGGGHDVAEEDGEFESELLTDEGEEFEHEFTDEGVFRYLCTPHEAQGMVGAVTVE